MPRVNIQQCQPEAYNAMFGLEKYLANSTIDADLQEIIRVRASRLNGCQFCIGMHTRGAEKLGVSTKKVAAIADWQQSNLFSPKEQAALAMSDSITRLSVNGLPDDVYQNAENFFNEHEMAQLIMLIATINAWNRIGVSMTG